MVLEDVNISDWRTAEELREGADKANRNAQELRGEANRWERLAKHLAKEADKEEDEKRD